MLSSGLLNVGRIPWGGVDPDPAGDPLPGKGGGGQDDHSSSEAERRGGGGGGGGGMGAGSVVNIVGGGAEREEPVWCEHQVVLGEREGADLPCEGGGNPGRVFRGRGRD